MSYDYGYTGEIKVSPGLSVKQLKAINSYAKGKLTDGPQEWGFFDVNEDGDALVPGGGEGHYEVAEWIIFFRDGILRNHKLNGTIVEECGDFMTKQDIVVENGEIFIVDYKLQPLPRKPYDPTDTGGDDDHEDDED